MSELSSSDWSETAASNNASAPNGWPEGQAPSTVNDCGRAMMAALKKFWNRINGGYASTGSANAYVLTPSVALAAYVTGERYSFRANFSNTGAATIDISSIGAKSLKKMTSSGKADPASGDIQSGAPVTVEYDGTDMILVTPTATSQDGAFALTGSANTFTADQTIQSADPGATAAPFLTLDRNSASPAASDIVGEVLFQGRDSGGNVATYGSIYTNIQDPADGSEDGALAFRTAQAGTLTVAGYFQTGLVVGTPTGTDKGAGTVNATAVYDDGVQLFGPRAVVKLTGMTGTPTVTEAFNSLGTLSASRTSAGIYTFSWTTALGTIVVPVLTPFRSLAVIAWVTATTSTSISVKVTTDADNAVDPDALVIIVYGA